MDAVELGGLGVSLGVVLLGEWMACMLHIQMTESEYT
jgi:hypothetical protein